MLFSARKEHIRKIHPEKDNSITFFPQICNDILVHFILNILSNLISAYNSDFLKPKWTYLREKYIVRREFYLLYFLDAKIRNPQ
jgi:hypothetical protein